MSAPPLSVLLSFVSAVANAGGAIVQRSRSRCPPNPGAQDGTEPLSRAGLVGVRARFNGLGRCWCTVVALAPDGRLACRLVQPVGARADRPCRTAAPSAPRRAGCGPELLPVEPERPMRWPATTDWPSFTGIADRCAYWL
ncbi:hypothetical protein SGRIM128S_08748 [Streptomyces griseomycini]